MKAIKKEPGEKPRIVSIPNTLEALQEAVGGRIGKVGLFEDACLVCDEEWRLKGKPYNNILGVPFGGTVLLVGENGEEFCDVPGGVFALKLMKGVC